METFVIPLGKPGVMSRYALKNVLKLCRYFGDQGSMSCVRLGKMRPEKKHPWWDKKFLVNGTDHMRVLLFNSPVGFTELCAYFSQYHIDLQPFKRFANDVYDVEMCREREVIRMETRGHRIKEEAHQFITNENGEQED